LLALPAKRSTVCGALSARSVKLNEPPFASSMVALVAGLGVELVVVLPPVTTPVRRADVIRRSSEGASIRRVHDIRCAVGGVAGYRHAPDAHVSGAPRDAGPAPRRSGRDGRAPGRGTGARPPLRLRAHQHADHREPRSLREGRG